MRSKVVSRSAAARRRAEHQPQRPGKAELLRLGLRPQPRSIRAVAEPPLAAARENGPVPLTLTGKQGSRYALETSTALPNWTSANLTVTVTNQSGAVTFPSPGATNVAQRFYRAVWQ